MNKMLQYLPICLAVLCFSCNKDESDPPVPPEPPIEKEPVAVSKTNSTKVYMHYMPWFETPESSVDGNWGMHWTMANRNPEIKDAEGKREIASYYYPLIGPYASGDRDVIEYHLLLMKYAGIDGVFIDWYGSYDANDYTSNRENSEALIDQLDGVGLSFAVTYEDRTLSSIVELGLANSMVEAAAEDFKYLEKNYFSLDTYVQINNQPLLTVFGPINITNGNDWSVVLESISVEPAFLSLWYESGELGQNASGEYAWVYANNNHVSNFYDNQLPKLDIAIGSAYPGFVDYYEEGGWGDEIGWSIDHKNGETLDETLQMASNAGVDHLQLVTWNDFGEGTMFEPTLEFGYMFLEQVQVFTGVEYSKTELEYINLLYNYRKNYAGNNAIQAELDKAFYHLVALEFEEAKTILDTFQ